MHYTGTIWRPPYEAGSLLLEVTAGCTYHQCKFCTLYEELPFKFRMSPLEDVEADLRELGRLGYDNISIGVETGDAESLRFMNKGYQAKDIVEQTHRLDQAGIGYHFMYLAGLPGAGQGARGALASAEIFNRTHPRIIGSSMLTIYPSSRLYQEIQAGAWTEESELEKLGELKALIQHLDIPVYFATLGASNAVWVEGELPGDRETMLARLEKACQPEREAALRHYRTNLPHL